MLIRGTEPTEEPWQRVEQLAARPRQFALRSKRLPKTHVQRLKQAHHRWLAAPELLLYLVALGAVIHYALAPEPPTILVLVSMLVVAFGMKIILLLL